MDEKIMIAASELVETVEKYLKQAVSRSILCLKLAALKEALQEEQPAEWSEEDERMRNQLIYDVEYYKKEGLASAKQNNATEALYNGIEKCYDEKIAWLKSLWSHSHWKPSEEQIGALKDVIDRAPLTCRQQVPLESLLNDLELL